MLGGHQVNVKSQSELDIGGRETCLNNDTDKFDKTDCKICYVTSVTSELLPLIGDEQDTCNNKEFQTKRLELSLMTDLIAGEKCKDI